MSIEGFCGLGLHFTLDGFRLVYVEIALLMWAASGIFSREYMAHYRGKKSYYAFFWATFLATVGVFLSADLYTTFIFFEIMSFTSFVWVIFDQKEPSVRAAKTYLAVAVIGGLTMLMGLFLLYDLLGTLEIRELRSSAMGAILEGKGARLYVAGFLLLFGFGAKAGCFPLHIWLPKAHPVAPAPASALLSGILTKTGIFGIIVVSCQIFGGDQAWGVLIVLLGLVTMAGGAFLAMFSINLKKTLACSSVSQIGFILTGIGMWVMTASAGVGPYSAARGTFLHMVNHSLFKLLLFLCAGAVYMNLHQLDLNEIRGYGRKRPFLCLVFLIGALGICGVPLWSGYASKTLLHESIVEYQEIIAEGLPVIPFGMELLGTGKVMPVENISSRPLMKAAQWSEQIASSPGFWRGAEWLFLLTGGMTVSYMLKLFVAIFVEKNPKRQEEFDRRDKPYMKRGSRAALLAPAVLIQLMGLLPSVVMDELADLGQGFFRLPGDGHQVHYFSLGNIKGSLISMGIGIVLYVFVIRGAMMAEVLEDGKKRRIYVDRWPGVLDLENLVYRPILLSFLPGVCGAVFGFLDRYLIPVFLQVFLGVSAVVCRAMDHLADGAILLARRTTHKQVFEKGDKRERDRLARWVGKLLDCLMGKEKAGKGAKSGRYSARVLRLMEKEEAFLETEHMVEESFSFGLMLFCIGLCLTLGYLLVVFFGLGR